MTLLHQGTGDIRRDAGVDKCGIGGRGWRGARAAQICLPGIGLSPLAACSGGRRERQWSQRHARWQTRAAIVRLSWARRFPPGLGGVHAARCPLWGPSGERARPWGRSCLHNGPDAQAAQSSRPCVGGRMPGPGSPSTRGRPTMPQARAGPSGRGVSAFCVGAMRRRRRRPAEQTARQVHRSRNP